MIPAGHKKLALAMLSSDQIDEIIADAAISDAQKREVRWEAARRQHERGEGPPPGDFPGDVILTFKPDEPRDRLDLDGRFIWGVDLNDEFAIDETYGTRAEAAAAGRLRWPGRRFQTARLAGVRQEPPNPFSAEGAIDYAADTARGEWWEAAIENFVQRMAKHAAELDELLKLLWTMWCAKHNIELSGYHAIDIEDHE